MPLPLPLPMPSGVPVVLPSQPQPLPGFQPYYVREIQDWAVHQEHMRHLEAIYSVGEWTMFALMWHILDFTAGRVERCNTCFVAYDVITEAYGQSSQNKCLNCFGTTFEGGIKAIIIRPTIFSDTDESERFDRRGTVHDDDVDIESTPDFRVRTGDYAFRIDGGRWQLKMPQRITLRTGFNFPDQESSAIGYNHARANLEDPTSVAYLIPPPQVDVKAILSQQSRWPIDFSEHEIIHGPLIPDDREIVT